MTKIPETSILNSWQVDEDSPYIDNSGDKIYVFFDRLHLLKSTRLNLSECNIEIKGELHKMAPYKGLLWKKITLWIVV